MDGARTTPDPDPSQITDLDGDGDIDADDAALYFSDPENVPQPGVTTINLLHDDVGGERAGAVGKLVGTRNQRPSALIATIGLVGVAGGSVAGLVYALVLGAADTASQSATTLGLVATGAVGGLLAIAGGDRKKQGGE